MSHATDELVLLSTGAMRARRNPIAIASVWAWESALALVLAWPVARIASVATGGSDGALWIPGGRVLLDVLSRERHAVVGLTRVAGWTAGVAVVAGIVPSVALLAALAFGVRQASGGDEAPVRAGRPGLARCLALGMRSFPAASIQLLLAGIAQAALVAVGALVASALSDGLTASLGEARAEQLGVLVLVPFAAAVSFCGVALDLARAGVVRFHEDGRRSVFVGLRALRASPLSAWWSWAWRAAASLAPVAAAAWVADRVGGRGGAALVTLAILHQAVVGVRVALRASWLAKALRIVDTRLKRGRPRMAEDEGAHS